MYASPSIEPLLHVNPQMIVGKPFLLYIRADDLASFVEQVDMAKSTNVITHMRFWFQSPDLPEEIPCEAMVFGSSDGMVAVLRRCKPFMRKMLIQDSGTYEFRSRERCTEHGYGISTSAPNTTSTGGATRRTTASRMGFGRPSPYNPVSAASVDDYLSTSSSTNSSSSSHPHRPPRPPTRAAMEGTRKIACPLTRLPQGSINCIRNMGQETKLRPLTSVAGSEAVSGAWAETEEDETSESQRILRRIHIQEIAGEDEDSSSSRDL